MCGIIGIFNDKDAFSKVRTTLTIFQNQTPLVNIGYSHMYIAFTLHFQLAIRNNLLEDLDYMLRTDLAAIRNSDAHFMADSEASSENFMS